MDERSSLRSLDARSTQRRNKYCVPGYQPRPIQDFYDEYYIGQADDNPNQPTVPSTYSVAHTSTASSIQGNDYILFIPGWNMDDIYHKEAWAETAFKRLWWQGYNGHLGLLRWPAYNLEYTDFSLFNGSDYNAFRSGAALKNLLVHLKGAGYSVNVLAHSQGNVVMAEALHEAKEDSTVVSPLVNGYVATQAAISTSFYSASGQYDLFSMKNLTRSDRPDLAAHFVASPSCDDPNALPYMAGTHDYARYWYNLYNNEDYGVGDQAAFLIYEGWSNGAHFSAWEWNDWYWRPWDSALIKKFSTTLYKYDSQGKQFYKEATNPDSTITRTPLDPAARDDRFQIFSYSFQPKGWPVGSHAMSDADWLWNGGQVNLDGDRYQYGNGHYAHDAQFMYSIAERWRYWYDLLVMLNIQHWGGNS